MQSVFYRLSIVLILSSVCILPRSVVCSPQCAFYIGRLKTFNCFYNLLDLLLPNVIESRR